MSETIGIVGIGVMGRNIALNFSDNDINVVVFNKSKDKIDDLIHEGSKKNISGFTSLNEFVKNIESPRNILLMVPSGEATNSVAEELLDLLDHDDVLIDGGNSFYKDSIELGNRCKKKKIRFVGMGVSGGETGARHGPALMLGTGDNIPENLLSMIKSISAKSSYGDCVGVYKGYGTGHFIKMLHNGIEYAEMQIIAEVYSILKNTGCDNTEIAKFFESLSDEKQSSYLIEISSKILRTLKDGKYVIDTIKSSANHKGTGKLTVETSLNYGFPLPSIFEALNARIESNYQNIWEHTTRVKRIEIDINELKKAIYFARLSTLTQGILFIEHFSKVDNLDIKIDEVMQNWLAGCIIRSDLLIEVKSYLEKNSQNESISKSEFLQEKLNVNLESTKNLVSKCIQANIPIQVINSSLNWYLNSSNEFNPSSLIQAQRDYFGRHTVQLLDNDNFINIEWTEDGN